MRLLILCLLIYFGYRLFKKWALSGKSSGMPQEPETLTMVDDVMVKDPFCQTYFPKKTAVKSVIDGEIYHFCSTVCRDKFMEAIKNSKQ
ncbi:MAG: YHS domain-containing protein [Desulfobacterales bacterium]|nr:YHS domain-containing protein [Desulfobacterales bacterium]